MRFAPMISSTSPAEQLPSTRTSATCEKETKSRAGEKSDPHSSRDGPKASSTRSTNGCAAVCGNRGADR